VETRVSGLGCTEILHPEPKSLTLGRKPQQIYEPSATSPSRYVMPRLTNPARYLWPLLLAILFLTLLTVYLPRTIQPSFAVETYAVGVYKDAAHTQEVESIDWGELTPGTTRQTQIYVRNEEVSPSCFIMFRTTAWTPSEASQYLALQWSYGNHRIPFTSTIPVTFTLTVTPIAQATAFSFNIIIVGTRYMLGDLDHDDAVIFYDFLKLIHTYGSLPTSPNWNPEADLNNDLTISLYDLILFAPNYGKTAQ
jgi:hypothetical protein